MENDLKRAGGLWLKDGKNGKYMTGPTEVPISAGSRLMIFKNDKQKESQPDYRMVFVEPVDQPPMHRAEPTAERAEPGDAAKEDIPF